MLSKWFGLATVTCSAALMALAVACSRDADTGPGGSSIAGSGGGVAADSGVGGNIINLDGAPGVDAGCVLEDGGPCLYAEVDAGPQCGDGLMNQPGEACDDGNRLAGDGCSGACQIEPNYVCPTPGELCQPLNVCGDSEITGIEQCDDGNAVAGDGCSALCFIEASYYDCTVPGQLCTSTAACGNGQIEPGENCDDGNPTAGDGCSAACTVELGWNCAMPGAHCTPFCGDGLIMAGAEECDDNNRVNGDGCSVSCRLEGGFLCTGPVEGPSTCRATICGDGIQEGSELCDSGVDNGLFYGDPARLGCSKTCTPEPLCRPAGGGPTTACTSQCGDGMIVGSEQCDDGDLDDNDGCSSTCQIELGFTCSTAPQSDATTCLSGSGECLLLPITYRDFKGQNEAGGHHDFFYYGATGINGVKTWCVPDASATATGDSTALCLNLVQATLDNDGKPAFNAARAGGSNCACQYSDWGNTGVLSDAPAANITGYTSGGNPIFTGNVAMIESDATFRQWYRDTAGVNVPVRETLELTGNGVSYQFSSSNGQTILDDIAARRTLNSGFFPLESQASATKICNLWEYWVPHTNCIAAQWDPAANPPNGDWAQNIQGVLRNFYFTTEVRYLFFYRDTTEATLSFYGDDDVWVFINGHLALDLGGTHQRLAGDVIINAANAAGWGLAPGNIYEIVVFHADRHPRDSNYQLSLQGFVTDRSTCGPTCGDATATLLEECDEGAANADGAYGGCQTDCTFGPYCGDGTVDPAYEQCDDGLNVTVGYALPGCAPGCVPPPRCGDSVVDASGSEECDNGDQNQDDLPGGCSTTCRINPSCGDGVYLPDHGEECDLGAGNEPVGAVSYGGCSVECTLGPHCGDGVLDPEELCDDGNNESQDGCSAICVTEMLVE